MEHARPSTITLPVGRQAIITPEPTLDTTLWTALLDLRPAAAWLLVGTLCAVTLLASSRVRRLMRRLKLKRRWAIARGAESRAVAVLSRQGYDVIGTQVEGTYSLQIDGTAQTVSLRADLLVERDHRRYVAEVKSGKLAPSITNATTRRQLLEYRLAFEVSGVLLVDGNTELVHRIEFPFGNYEPRASARAYVVGFWLLLAAAAAALAWLL